MHYRHVGSLYEARPGHSTEARARCSASKVERQSLAGLFKHGNARPEERLRVGESVCGSILMLHAGAWAPVGSVARKALDNEIMALARAAVGANRTGGGHDRPFADVAREYGVQALDERLHVAHARYFRRCIVNGPELLWALIEGTAFEKSWASETVAALRWLKRHCNLLSDMPDPLQGSEAWAELAAGPAARWKHYVRFAG